MASPQGHVEGDSRHHMHKIRAMLDDVASLAKSFPRERITN